VGGDKTVTCDKFNYDGYWRPCFVVHYMNGDFSVVTEMPVSGPGEWAIVAYEDAIYRYHNGQVEWKTMGEDGWVEFDPE
jgi:hypothetical protein